MTNPAVSLTPTPRQLFLNPSNGTPAAGFKVFFYQAGSTTKQAVYVDSTGATPATNPAIVDSLGELDIWLDITKSYKFVFANPNDTDPPTNPIWTRDNISVFGGSVSFVGSLPGFIGGLMLSTAGGVGTFGIAAGTASDSTAAYIMKLAAAYTKTTAAWAVGSAQGSLDTGSIAPSSTYHVYEIARLDTNVVDIIISLSATGPALPANYTIYRRIGSMITDGSSHWKAFTQNGNEFLWVTPVTDQAGAAFSGTLTNYALTVPTGIIVNALFGGAITGGAPNDSAFFYSPIQTGGSNNGYHFIFQVSSQALDLGQVNIRTNTAAQITAQEATTGAPLSFQNILTQGWIDTRGQG